MKIFRGCRDFKREGQLGSSAPDNVETDKAAQEKEEKDFGWLRQFDPLIDIRFLAELTQFTSEFVLYPFVVLMVFMISRAKFLDQFDWTPWYVLIVIVGFGIVLVLAMVMRSVAEASRQRAMRNLATKVDADLLLPEEGVDENLRTSRQEFALHALEEIRDLQVGAFSPWAQNPVIWAVLTPLTGVGGINLLQYLMK